MTLFTPVRKAAIAALMATPLVLTACGADEEPAEDTTTATTSATSSAVTSEETTEETTEVDPEDSEAEEPEQAEDTLSQGEGQLTPDLAFAENEPVAGGQPASPEDEAAINDLVRGIEREATLRSAMAYVPYNACTRVLEEQGGIDSMDFSVIPDVPLSQIPGGVAPVQSVEDVVVEGETASATVVTGEGAATQRFLREGGSWKFCN